MTLNRNIEDRSRTLGYPDLTESIRDMKDADVQKVLEFILNELSVHEDRIKAVERNV